MDMLTSLEITNYRGFKSYRLEGLSQVNLLVGKNNSGKTALAEAIHLVTSGGDPVVLSDAAQRRGEMTVYEDTGRVPRVSADLTHFFHGHSLSPDSSFKLRSDNDYPPLTVRLVPIPEDPSLFSESTDDIEGRPAYGVQIEGGIGFGSGVRDLWISDRGGLIFNTRARARLAGMTAVQPTRPTVFVPTDSVAPRPLSQLWRHAILDLKEQDVIAAMQLVAQSIKQIVYLPPEGGPRTAPSWSWYVHTTEFEKPIPLGSLGDGTRPLMNLALALIRVVGGTLLVDEIDTGLHYSVMADMWKLVVGKAAMSNTQVFATTHSWDCIEGLSLLCQHEPDLMSKVSIHTIDNKLPHSIAFAGESIVRMVKHQIDPR